jgi:N,N'-diacetylbacillosaminyl-diphospho-undecaprenol alpha-1,3-N-acetylgalactosaminyltransferase
MVIATKSLTRNEILAQIWDTVPVGSPAPTEPKTLARLRELTNSLIDVSDRVRLKTHPFQEVLDRRISFDRERVESILKDRVILITGGAGFVGGHLISHLKQLGVKRIISLDVASDENICFQDTSNPTSIPCIHYHADVRDYDVLKEIFAIEQPNIVFHLAAQRLPGLAETQIYQTVSTNILGSDNIIRLCEEFQVQSCIFASTGKASRYYTPDIYAGSKKIAEWLFADRLDQKKCLYGIVRFTHVVENSPISLELDKRVAQGLVSLHAPDRFTYAQNVTEAIYLLLNALTLVKRGSAKVLAVTNLGWPVNTLDIALHKIVCAGGNIPLYFKGVPKGYETSMFMGQLDLSGDREIIPMLNVLEVQDSQLSPAKDMVIAELHPYSSKVLATCMTKIKDAMVEADLAIRTALSNGVKQMAISSFRLANPIELLDIIGWGIDPEQLAQPGVDRAYYHEFAELLLAGLYRRMEYIDRDRVSPQAFAAITYLKTIPSAFPEAIYADSKLNQSTSVGTKVIQNIHFPVSARSFVAPIVEHFNKAGIDTELWVENKPKHAHVLEQLNVPKKIVASDLVSNPIKLFKRILDYRQQIKTSQPNVVHVHQSRASLIPLIASYLERVPVRIYHNHGLPYLGYTGPMRWFLKAIEQINIALATHVLLVSKSNLEEAIADGLLTAERGQVVGSGSIAGIDLDKYQTSQFDEEHQGLARDKFEIDRQSFVLGYVGRPFKRKGFHRLLTAWKASGLADKGGILLIAGCSQSECTEAMGEEIGGVRALGYINDLREFYAACDTTVLPSYHEGFSYAILESAAAGRPTIGSDIPGTRCAIQHEQTGWLFPVDDDRALLEAIVTLAEDEDLRKRLGTAARNRVEREFSREVVLGSLLAYYQQIFNEVQVSTTTTELMLDRPVFNS